MKEKGEISNDKLEAVAGGQYDHPIVQLIMGLKGFKEEWIQGQQPRKGRRGGLRCNYDEDFVGFLYKHFDHDKANYFMNMFGNQREMFAKDES